MCPRDRIKLTRDRSEQIEGGSRILTRRLGQRVDTDHAGLIDAKVELPPTTPAAVTVCRGHPLTCPDDGQPRTVEYEMEALAGRDRSQTVPQMLTAPGERRIVGGGEVEAHYPEQGVQDPFGLAQREMVEEPQGHDGEIRVAPLPAPPAAPAGCPGSDRFRGQPHRHIAASNEGLVIGRPVCHAVRRLIRGMNLRLHPWSVTPAEGPEKCGPRCPTRRSSFMQQRLDLAPRGRRRVVDRGLRRADLGERILPVNGTYRELWRRHIRSQICESLNRCFTSDLLSREIER